MQKRSLRYLIYLILCLLLISDVHSTEKKYYFYNPDNRFGSDLYFNPANVVINGSYDILRNGGHTKNITEIDYKTGWDNVFYNVLNPIDRIEEYGWKNFLNQECFNLTLDSDKGQFVPNLTTHLIGNGMLYVMMAEWYDYHGVKFPYFCSFISTKVYQIMNESIENGKYSGLHVDPISDMLIFEPLGIILFSTEFGKKLFTETFSLHYWSLQPLINPANYYLENAGQQYILRKKLPFCERYSFFFYWGINGLGGITYSADGINKYSAGLGTVANKLHEKRLNGGRFLTPVMDGAMGFFYDRNNSLMCSLLLTGPRMYNARINVYPGFLFNKWYAPGAYIGFGEWDKFLIGITFAHLPVGVYTGSPNRK
ncbi:MAG: hypothetical protein P9X24_18525 [Candidatus Hatepunaea meridiana]|nr:hypothetical protein [Candidatus Hatepunaea meridiana]